MGLPIIENTPTPHGSLGEPGFPTAILPRLKQIKKIEEHNQNPSSYRETCSMGNTLNKMWGGGGVTPHGVFDIGGSYANILPI